VLGLYVQIEGDRELALRFERLPDAVQSRLVAALQNISEELAARQRAAAPRRTGRLASEIGKTAIHTGPGFVRASVTVAPRSSSDAAKAGALEYGAPGRRGRFTVRAHQRRHGGITQVVHRYDRTARLIESRYIRGPYQAMKQKIEDEIRAAIVAGFNETE
jgi:Bacteriophage HK97-gp10, putative tail-component